MIFFKILFLFTFLIRESFASGGSVTQKMTVHFFGKTQELVVDETHHLSLSRFCFQDHQCVGWDALQTASLKKVQKSSGGANPASLICAQFGGLTHIELDQKGNEQGFCVFKDESIVSTGSLFYFAVENDKHPKESGPR